ncbi:MAG: methyltransferase domain-containing protein [Zhengella sp.]|uniref:class I SAM-dependent methyltransferase n=1 Tax=Zhengella sp. TaxID=2282762 RepID=UPI001D92E23D|nr:methyltransferase domain-containing protein [Notoacmeibacter sp.]MCC0025839.1 methyltransferase domain-containing protein [Brucellaceae bacterium]
MENAVAGHAALMDGVYRYQRHVYDVTRKFYLLGRDHLIGKLQPPAGGSVLEIGCGTGRNLAAAAARYPCAQLYGIDISAEMLKSAGRTLARSGAMARTRLALGDATALDPQRHFGVDLFDRVFISYSLSMIPDWESALGQAALVLKPGGSLHVVDFGQQEELPAWFKMALHAWLARFHVTPRATLHQEIRRAARAIGGTQHFQPLYRDYARYGMIRRAT